jgi:uncharacterized DUF497 family protein
MCLTNYCGAVEYSMGVGMNYDWDPAKEAINQQKHGISLIDATAVFDDPHHIFEDSTRPEHGERRGKASGAARRSAKSVSASS